MSSIDKMIDNFKDFAELKAYAEAQYRLTVELSKKINALEEERNDLKKVIENSHKGLILDPAKAQELFVGVKDEEAICLMQLKLLRNISIERELTLEEAKRVEIYNKILNGGNTKKAEEPPKIQAMTNDELSSLLKEIGNESK